MPGAGGKAFQRMDVPIIGVIENMSGEVFGKGGGQQAAYALGVEFLGSIELDSQVAPAAIAAFPLSWMRRKAPRPSPCENWRARSRRGLA